MTEAHSLVAARQLFVRYGDASGLLLDPVNPSAGQVGPVIYICDVESSRSLLLETAQDALHKLSERAERYPDAVTDKHRLTPMPVFKSHPIMATELEATVNHMLLSEQLNFPERFPAHPPTQFRQVRRNVLSGKI